MERGKKFVQNFVQGKKAMSSTQALLLDIEEVVFEQTRDPQSEIREEPFDEAMSFSDREDREEEQDRFAGKKQEG